MLKHLGTLQQNGLLAKVSKSGIVLYADDQFVNQQSLKMHFQDIGIEEKLHMVSNGKDVIKFLDVVLKDIDADKVRLKPL